MSKPIVFFDKLSARDARDLQERARYWNPQAQTDLPKDESTRNRTRAELRRRERWAAVIIALILGLCAGLCAVWGFCG